MMINKLFLSLLLVVIVTTSYSQNKTLGVGVETPNPNAALHVESPTNNQGMIMPRLTTAQRTAMSLTTTDKGLLVYDTDLNGIFSWNGASWQSGGKILYPYADNITVATGTPDLFALKYDNDENKRIMRIENNNAVNGSSALSVLNKGAGIAGYFQVLNPASSSSAVYGTTNSDAGGPLAPPGIYGESTGSGSLGGAFRITNASNPFPTVYAETNGIGSALNLNVINASSSAPALNISHAGTGNAIETSGIIHAGQIKGDGTSDASILGNNSGNGFGVHGISSGTNFGSAAVYGEHTGTGDAAGAFRISNAGSSYAALYGETNGTSTGSSAVRGLNLGGGNGAYFRKNGSNPTTAAMWADNFGTNGYGAIIQNVDAGNPTAALFVEAVGTGPSVWANKDTGETGDTFLANHSGSSGNIAVFQNGGSNVARIDKTGQAFFNGGTQNSGADVAEAFEVEGDVEEYEPGDVLVISEKTDRTVEKSSTPSSRKVVGVFATKPGVLLTEKGIEDNLGNTVPMGVIGVIPTKVSLENGPIKRGDLLVTSSEPGKAMKAKPMVIEGIEIYPQGAIIGKALENYDGTGKALINVLVNVK